MADLLKWLKGNDDIAEIFMSDDIEYFSKTEEEWKEREAELTEKHPKRAKYAPTNPEPYEYKFFEFVKQFGPNFKRVDGYGGEDMGSDYYSVYHFPDQDMYIKFQGWYASYEGSEYEKCYQVAPREVTEVKYLKVED